MASRSLTTEITFICVASENCLLMFTLIKMSKPLTSFISTFARFHMKWPNICSKTKDRLHELDYADIKNKYFMNSLNQKTVHRSIEEINSLLILSESSKWCQSQVNMEGAPDQASDDWWPFSDDWDTQLIESAYLYGGAMELLTGCDGLHPLSWAGK